MQLLQIKFLIMDLRIISFNCNSIRNNVNIVENLFTECDILLLQETLISSDDLYSISNINLDFESAHIPSFNPFLVGNCGRLRGGLSIFWHKKLDKKIAPITYSNEIIGLKLSFNSCSYLILNIYMPCDDRSEESLFKFRRVCAKLAEIKDNENVNHLILAGDFNSDPNKGRFWEYLMYFINNENLFIADEKMPNDSFTYFSPAHSSTSWIDHVVTSNLNLIKNIAVLYGATVFDHIPLKFELSVPYDFREVTPCDSVFHSIDPENFILWPKVTKDDKELYRNSCNFDLLNYDNSAGVSCKVKNCTLNDHCNDLRSAYDYFVNTLFKNSERLTISYSNKRNFKVIPGWSERCKNLYHKAREAFIVWKQQGMIRSGALFESMKMTRSNFKNALRQCKKDEEIIRKQKFAQSFQNKDKINFWKELKKFQQNNKSVSSKIDGIRDPKAIVEIFNNKYKSIFDDSNCQKTNLETDDFTRNNNSMYSKKLNFHFYPSMISKAIQSINDCLGCDGLHANHLKLLGHDAHVFLSNFFNALLCHGMFPLNMLKGEIRPIVKDKFGNLEDSNNFRPIMISSNLLKIFEYCIIDHLNCALVLNNRQFGFRNGTSTIMAVNTLKETILNYTNKGSKVYTAFIDLSKAFDKVDHYKLINKLSASRVSPSIVNILKFLYKNQLVHTSYNNVDSNEWRLGNGVRQGAIISPVLFNFYINDILNYLSAMNIGCNLSYLRHNTQGYADDITIMAPSILGLQTLINTVVALIDSLSLTVNESKSVCMIFGQKQKVTPPKFFINNKELLIVNKYKYLGIVLSDDGRLKEDIRRCELSFLRQFYAIFRKFYFLDRNILIFLFRTYCFSFYGCELWSDLTGSRGDFRAIATNYHSSIKKLMGVSRIHSNHNICEEAGLPIFYHLTNLRMLAYAFNLFNSRSVCLAPHKSYFLYHSNFIQCLKENFNCTYNISNIFENEYDALISRVIFVQTRERRSTYYLQFV